jgi:hypothetical protein
MQAGRWRRLVLAIALFALAGTPAARAACAAACDPSAAHAGHAALVHEAAHVHHHETASEDSDATARAVPAGAPGCDEAALAAVAGSRASDRTGGVTPWAAASAPAPVRPPTARPLPTARPRPRPPGGAAAPLPLRI